MRDVFRYTLRRIRLPGGGTMNRMEIDAEGEWVRYEDYQAALESLKGAAVIAAAHGFGRIEPPSCMDCGHVVVVAAEGGWHCPNCGNSSDDAEAEMEKKR